MNQRGPWRLDPEDVSVGWSGGAPEPRARAAKAARADTSMGAECRLLHVPTGIKVNGAIPRGYYSRTEMNTHKDALYKELFPLLEARVAAHLRGRRR
jgi:hypothetical protein